MKPDKDDWSELSAVWSEPSRDGAGRPGADVIHAVRRRALWGRLNFWFEAGGAVVAAAAVALIAFLKEGGWPLALAGLAFCSFSLGMTIWSRRDVGEALTDTPAAALTAAMAQARSGARWGAAGLAVCAACAGFLTFLTRALGVDGGLRSEILVIAGVALIGLAVFYVNHIRVSGRRLKQAQTALADLERDELSRE